MKKIAILIISLLVVTHSYSQVFNSATTLKPLKFSVGFEPGAYANDFMLFLHGGMGIKSGIDLGVKYGIIEGTDYFGADLEWRLLQAKVDLSLTTGVHTRGHIGVDFGFNVSFNIKSDIALYSGLDLDLEFYDSDYDDDTDIEPLLWIPLGVDIKLRSYLSLIIEAELPVSDAAFGIIGGGILFYF